MVIKPWYLTGLIEGEGCFSISFTLRKRLKLGIEVRPSFSISLNRRDLALIKDVHAFFNCGGVRYSRADRTYKFEIRSIGDLMDKVIPHFKRYPLQGAKLEDFRRFEEICRSVRANLHKNKQQLVKIIEIAYKMNPAGKRKHQKADLLKVLGEIMV